ncbi:hypothetical protein AB4140_16825 [Shewanella sp. 10N.286.51.B2]|uniref:hypothetical protein n=1 Tax=Shewanella sp. 10N.286.51.B2 TaxID=3229707 RepID=UPI00354EE2D2
MDQSQVFRLYPKSSNRITENYSLLLLANVDSDNGTAKLWFERYIYLHLDKEGHMLGISISESLLYKHADLGAQYLTGVDMIKILLMYKDEITAFCEMYSLEFQTMFGLCPTDYFEFAAPLWVEYVNALN